MPLAVATYSVPSTLSLLSHLGLSSWGPTTPCQPGLHLMHVKVNATLPHCHTASPPYPTTHHTQHQHTAYLLYTCKTPARASQSCKQRQPHARKSIRRLLQFKVQRVQQASEAHLVRPCPHSQAATPATSYNDVTVDVGIQEEGQFFAVTACRAERKHRHKVRHLFGPAMTSATGDVLCLPQACSQSA